MPIGGGDWRENPNHWRAITRLDAARSGSAHQRRRARTRRQTNVDWQTRTMTRYDVFVWLSLVGFVTLCAAAIGVIFSVLIKDIPQDHPDYMRIVIALNEGQCPDCDARGLDFKPRAGLSRNNFCKACDQGFNVEPDPPRVLFVQRIGRRSRA